MKKMIMMAAAMLLSVSVNAVENPSVFSSTPQAPVPDYPVSNPILQGLMQRQMRDQQQLLADHQQAAAGQSNAGGQSRSAATGTAPAQKANWFKRGLHAAFGLNADAVEKERYSRYKGERGEAVRAAIGTLGVTTAEVDAYAQSARSNGFKIPETTLTSDDDTRHAMLSHRLYTKLDPKQLPELTPDEKAHLASLENEEAAAFLRSKRFTPEQLEKMDADAKVIRRALFSGPRPVFMLGSSAVRAQRIATTLGQLGVLGGGIAAQSQIWNKNAKWHKKLKTKGRRIAASVGLGVLQVLLHTALYKAAGYSRMPSGFTEEQARALKMGDSVPGATASSSSQVGGHPTSFPHYPTSGSTDSFDTK